MAKIIRDRGRTPITEAQEVKKFLQARGVAYEYWEVPVSVNSTIQKATLSAGEKNLLLDSLEYRFTYLEEKFGYKTRDLIVLHADVPGLDNMLAKFDKVHYHTDEEVRYIVDGSGVFGFAIAGEKFLVHVAKHDFISVPKNTRHWFYLDETKRIKAIRYFTDMAGWVPNYVEETTEI
ncbi:MAG: cupin domain-containing protein [Spirochaetota bacterium]